jgi:glycosyltransferase involved in cell wall biosynthesis
MRVLAIVQSYFPFQERGGPVFKVRSIAKGLAERGHKVTILTADLGGWPKDGPAASAENHRLERCAWGWQARNDNVETIYLSTLARYRALTINPGVIGFSRVSLSDFDVVHVFGMYDLLGPIVSHFCRRHVVPYVIEPMGMYRPIVRNIELKRLYHRVLGNQMIGGAQFIVATSQQERRELLESKVDETRIIVRRNGIEPPGHLPSRGEFRKRWKIVPKTKIILFLGRLVSKKSPDLLLRAFAGLRSRGPEYENSVLVLAGPDEGDGFASELKAVAEKLRIADSVLFVGPLYDEQKWQAYRDADVFVLPSQNENFGNTAVESAVCGTPVIVTDQCGIASYVGAAGLVIRHNAGELERALMGILADADFHAACKNGCVQMADALSWQEPLEQTEELYQRCLSDRVFQETVL